MAHGSVAHRAVDPGDATPVLAAEPPRTAEPSTAEPSTAGASAVPQRRLLRTQIPGPLSARLHERKLRAVACGVGTSLPVYIERAGGGILVDVDGNQLIDLGSGIAVTGMGNADPTLVAALSEQATRFTHTCFMVTPYEGYVAVCEGLARITPGAHEKRSALFNSGAEAVENAVKAARHATGRPAVVVFEHAYHGRTNLTMAMTAKAMPYKRGFGPFAGEVYRAPMSYPFREPALTGAQAAERSTILIESQVGADQVAAVVVEPIQGEGGFIVPAPGFLPGLRRWCTDNGVLLVADEIQTGFGRTGDAFACEHEGVVPDLVTTAKGIAGGMPLAGLTGRAEVLQAVHPGGLGGTYGGNPVACAASLTAIAAVESGELPARARHVESVALPRLRELADRLAQIGDVRGRGGMLAIELVRPGTTEPDAALTARVAAACHAAGVVVLTCGTFGNVIRLLPPLVIGDDLLTEGLDVLAQALGAAVATGA